MKDLSIFYIANRAFVESVERVGYEVTQEVLPPDDYYGQETFQLPEDLDPTTLVVYENGVELFRFNSGGTIPAGRYRLETVNGYPTVRLYRPLVQEVLLVYSTREQTAVTIFEVRGRNFTYATTAKVGDEEVEFTVINDNNIKLRVPTTLASVVNPQTVAILVTQDSNTNVTDVIFDISTANRGAQGTRLLMQRFITLLLSPEVGNLDGLLPKGMSNNPLLRTIVLSRVTAAVNAVRNRMLKSTANDAPPEETLMQAAVESVNVDERTNTIEVSIMLRTAAGTNVRAPLSLTV